MAPFTNPPLLTEAPTDGQVAMFVAATGQWDPVDLADLGALAVPQANIVDFGAVAAATGGTVATADAADQSVIYVEADVDSIATLANALKVAHNLTATDVATLVTELGSLRTKFNTLLTELETAGILSP